MLKVLELYKAESVIADGRSYVFLRFGFFKVGPDLRFLGPGKKSYYVEFTLVEQ